ncbi:MAG: aminoacetone oxidase family FAD-binding enzyme [Christensenellaceae bacterium]|jgi:predicted Rossmann fold flavoprotein|nr:aminoacetone oxidase family FAD-binding enzyme [Christensenellaceae bacterium]
MTAPCRLAADVLIIGGGASGLMAAATAAKGGKSVLVLEAGERVGKKLLATGNGRCNLSNLGAEPPAYFGDVRGRLLAPEALLARFAELGLACAPDPEGRLYPLSESASSVLDVLRLALARHGAREICGFSAEKAQKTRQGFLVTAQDGREAAGRALILACGSPAASAADGYALARGLGHSVTPLLPGLCPLPCESPALLKGLRGLRVKCEASLLDGETLLARERGEVLFKDAQISGILAFDLSRHLRGAKKPVLSLDLLPGAEDISGLLRARQALFGSEPAAGFFMGLLHKQIGLSLLARAGISPSARVSGLGRNEILALASLLRGWRFPVEAPRSFAGAQLALGGVPASELRENSLQSRLCEGLFLCGELLDVDGPCGGFNLHFAFGSGHLAALELCSAYI